MIHSIWVALANKLQSVQGLHSFFDYAKGEPDGYPFATLTIAEGESEFGDSAGNQSARNLQKQNFIVRVYQERDDDLFGPQKAERVSIEVLDEILTALYMDTTLSGTVKYQRPTEWSAGYDVQDKVVRTLEINIETLSIVNSK